MIPEDWQESQVGREFEIQLGKMLDADGNSGLPKTYIGNRSVQWGRFDLEDLATMRMSLADTARYRLRSGDLLVCEGGEIGRAAIWEGAIEECYYQKALHRLRPVRDYDPRLLLAFLRFWVEQGKLSNFVTQTSIAHLTREKLVRVPLPKPSLSEQRAIAATLSDVDALLASLDRLIAKQRDLKQAAMQQLLTGEKRLPGFSGKWTSLTLGRLGSFSKGRGITKDQVRHEGLPCIRYGEIYTYHHDIIRSFRSFISRAVARQSCRLNKGDIVFAGSGETAEEIGKCVAYLGDEEAYVGSDTVILRPAKSDPCFLGYLLNHRSVAEQKARMGQGDAVVHINARNLAEIRISLPTEAEQSAIATVVSDMDAEITALEHRREKTRLLKQGMMQELLTGRTRLV